MVNLHPLRPKEGFVLVCEGRDDLALLSGIASQIRSAKLLSVYEANGQKNVNTLRAILTPAVSIVDRDFRISRAEARTTLSDKNNKSYWARVDLESYLLYADWLFYFVEQEKEAPKTLLKNPPNSETQIQEQIKSIASRLIYDHAGRRTIALVSGQLDPFRYKPRIGKEHVDGGAEASGYEAWKRLLRAEAQRIQKDNVSFQQRFAEVNMLTHFEEQIDVYKSATHTIQSIREEFSGKRILQALTAEWGSQRKWTVVQKLLIEEAIKHSAGRMAEGRLLNNDERLGDIGLLLSKVVNESI